MASLWEMATAAFLDAGLVASHHLDAAGGFYLVDG
jgi:hypothetical protein